jgi:hypothetical protein
VVSNVTVTPGPNGPLVNWIGPAGAASHYVLRYKSDDRSCCSNSSPTSPPLTGPPWQDTPPAISGTYIYEVTVVTGAGSATAQTQYVYQAPGRIAGAPVGPPGGRIATPAPGGGGVPNPIAPATPTAGLVVTVTAGPQGPVVSWTPGPARSTYTAQRWKIDDPNCCNHQSPPNQALAGTTWQDNPLPQSGTYVYQVTTTGPFGSVTGQTQFGWRQPGGPPSPAPIAVAPVSPQTGTTTPLPPPAPTTPPPTTPSTGIAGGRARGATGVGSGPAPENLVVDNSAVLSASLSWDPVPGAVHYLVGRVVQGMGAPTPLTGTPITQTSYTDQPLPDPTRTYLYQVTAFQGDGSNGSATVVRQPSTRVDPWGFNATDLGGGQVRLSWHNAGGSHVILSGPGTGTGVTLPNNMGGLQDHVVTGVSGGTHTWTIAHSWQPWGVLSPAAAWPTASATIAGPSAQPNAADPQRYRLIALGFEVKQTGIDDVTEADGKGDEVYLAWVTHETTLPQNGVVAAGTVGQAIRTYTHGDAGTAGKFPGRVQAGSAGPTGGLRPGDRVPASLNPTGPTGTLQSGSFPTVLWEGTLDAQSLVLIHPTLWEDDRDPTVFAVWLNSITQYAQAAYNSPNRKNTTLQVIGKRLADGILYSPTDKGDELVVCQNDIITMASFGCRVHGHDRPIGLRAWYHADFGHEGAAWDDLPLVLTKASADFLADYSSPSSRTFGWYMSPGTLEVLFHDFSSNQHNGSYVLYFRVERVP